MPSGKGERLIILQAGWEQGWIPNAACKRKKGSGGFHKEMNTAHFMEWFRESLILRCQL